MWTQGLRIVALLALVAARPAGTARADAPPAGRVPAPKEAVAPITPAVPGDVVASLQAGRYAEAAGRLEGLVAGAKPEDRPYLHLLRGVALRLDRKFDAAREALEAGIEAAPDGPWAPKLRAESVAVALADNKFVEAEAIARAEADRLLDGDRKDRLARVYAGFGERLLSPPEPTTPADPEGAFALLAQARDLAQGPALRAELLLAMGRASLKAGNPARAIENFAAYLREFPEGADRVAARFALGEARLAAGDPPGARLAWADLVRDLEGVDAEAGQETRARALFGIAQTYGLPNPPDDTSLNLGVAALRRLLDAHPSHPQAVEAAFLIGLAYQNRGKSEDALAAFRAFLAGEGPGAGTGEARRLAADFAMRARFLVGEILRGQGKFAEAIEAWRGYLANDPNGPQSAAAQQAIVDTRLEIAGDHLRVERFEQARAAWEAFVAEFPLDPRVPQALFGIGQGYAAEERWDEAIAAWETLAGKFPGTEPAGHAQYQIAFTLENPRRQPAEAIERYKQVAVEPWAGQARQRIALMEAKALTVVTPRTYRSGETPRLEISTRNLEKLTFTAYRLDPEAYFRKKQVLQGVEGLDIGLVQPDAEWTADVPGFEKYAPIEEQYELDKLEVPGVYVVKVTDEKSLQATTLVLGSDLDAIVKVSRDQLLVFAQDMKTGAGRAGARVLVSDGESVVFEGKTGADGVLLDGWKEPRGPDSRLHYLVLDDRDVAGSGLGVPGRVADGLTARAYLYTDRPAYRPGQEAQVRGVVREVADGRYDPRAGAEYRLEVYDSRGRRFVDRAVTLSEFGTFHAGVPVDSAAPTGSYRIRLFQPGKSDFSGGFEVQAYQLQKVDLEVKLPRTVYFRGETVEGEAVARYQYGTPLADRAIEVRLPDGRALAGKTDAAGKFAFSFPTEGYAEEQALGVLASLPQDGVSASAAVRVAVRAFSIGLDTTRTTYLDGESFPLRISTTDALGEPTGQALTVTVLKVVAEHGRTAEREVERERVTTDAKTGAAELPIRVDDEEGGRYVLRAAGTDRFGNPVVESRSLTISGSKDAQKLRLLADATTFRVGQEAKVRLVNRAGAGTALLTWEADRVLRYKLVELAEGDNPVAWEVDGDQFPNFSLAAARMSGTEFHQARMDLRAERNLRVEIKPRKAAVGPGEEVELEVTARDQLDRPVAAELSIALIDRALLRLHGDRLPPIDTFFYNQARTGAFSTEATNTFRYQPTTTPVSEALVEDQEQMAARLMDEAERMGRVQLFADGVVPAPKPGMMAMGDAPRSPSAEADGMGGMGGYALQPGDRLPEVAARKARAASEFEGGEQQGQGQAGRDMPDMAQFRMRQQGPGFVDRNDDSAKDGRFGAASRGAMAALPREQYVETAYWNPAVVTDANGKAVVKFPAPSALSEYRFTARGASGADTLVGQAAADLAVRRDFFVDLKLPPTLTEGDRPRFAARLHHRGVKGPAKVTLTLYAGGRETVVPRTVELKGDGVADLGFEPFEVPGGDLVRITLAAEAGDASDRLVASVPIRPWGVQALATASGTASDDATAFVALPPGRPYESPEMLVVVAPTLRRLVVELALGRDAYPFELQTKARILPPPSETTADRASGLLAVGAAIGYLRASGGSDAPEASRLAERGRALVAELITTQNEDGGWAWVAASPDRALASDRMTTARALWALAVARPLGLGVEPSTVDRAANWLTQELARVESADQDTRAALLHALGTAGRATFEQANSLNRLRQDLSDSALAHLALTFADLDRPSLAAEVLAVLGPRAKSEPVAPGVRPRRYWEGKAGHPWLRSPAETTGLAALAFARVRPDDALVEPAIDWLLAHRIGTGWQPAKARGPAVAALGAFYGRARAADDAFRLVVTVNEQEVYRADVRGTAEGEAIRVPLEHVRTDGRNRVHFDFEGRGTYGYSVTLAGFARDFAPDQDRTGKPFAIDRRVYLAATPEFEGRPLPTGFATAVNAEAFVNKVGSVAPGGRAVVELRAFRIHPQNQPAWERDFLVLEEHLPAGVTLVEGSVQTTAAHHELADGVLTFYFAPDQYPGDIRYEVFGYLPGDYRALPPQIRSAYDPGRSHLGPVGDLKVLPEGQRPDDPYRPTPDELYARGKALFDDGRPAEAAAPLEALWEGYTLRDDVAKDAARMLLKVHIAAYEPRKVVRYFEVLKEKAPELVVPFAEIRVVGRAYADIGEQERAYLVWRATSEASYLEDARVGEVLRQRGRTLEGLALLLDLWREYPGTASIQADFFGLSQVFAGLAANAVTDADLRRELARAGVTRSDLLAQEIRLILGFLSLSPGDPVADEASLALVGAFLELEDFPAVVELAGRYAGLYTRSRYLDSFQYAAALGHFNLGQHDEAIGLAGKIAESTYRDESGVEQPSPNKWEALYILGQIHDARHQPAEAVAFYRQVADRFGEAASAVKALTRKELKLPEVAVVRPPAADRVARGVGLRALAPRPPRDEPREAPRAVVVDPEADAADVTLTTRNLPEADVKVYAVDLMRLYLERRNLDDIAAIDLAGIKPLVEATVKLADGPAYDRKDSGLDLPLDKEGAYLVMARGDDLYASGIVLVSPLELEVLEEADAGRVRVRVRDARTGAFVPKVQVRVIGSANPAFFSGETDLRGVFVAEGVAGQVTAVARKDTAQYAFYRGESVVGRPPVPSSAPMGDPGQDFAPAGELPQLQKNIREQNLQNSTRQLERLQQRYNAAPMPGVQVDSAADVPMP